MKFKYLIISLLIGFFSVISANAQVETSFFQDIEIFGGIGASNYFGDIGGRDTTAGYTGAKAIIDNLDIDFWQTRVALFGGARFTRWKSFALTAQLSPVFLSGSDYRSSYEKLGAPGRPYEFKTTLVELSAIGEYYFAKRLTGFAPYCSLGFSGMMFRYENSRNDKPKWDNGNTIILGLGMRFPSYHRITHSLDLSYHFTTTDYLDGFITNRNTKDMFMTLSYRINIESYSLWTYDHRGRVK